MKLSLSTLALIATAVTLAAPAYAQNYPWCALYSGGGVGGGTNCGFVSFEQCMATASGLGKFCVRNTQYVPTAPAKALSVFVLNFAAAENAACGSLAIRWARAPARRVPKPRPAARR
jgi:hypothetical protein